MQSKASFYLFISKVNSKVLKTKQNSVGILFINQAEADLSQKCGHLFLFDCLLFSFFPFFLFSLLFFPLFLDSPLCKNKTKNTLLLEFLIFDYNDWTKFGQIFLPWF